MQGSSRQGGIVTTREYHALPDGRATAPHVWMARGWKTKRTRRNLVSLELRLRESSKLFISH
jgi:hypothetical protein